MTTITLNIEVRKTKFGQEYTECWCPVFTHQVHEMEYERGWENKMLRTLYFRSEEDAKEFVKQYNSKYNSEKEAPDWYILVSYTGEVK